MIWIEIRWTKKTLTYDESMSARVIYNQYLTEIKNWFPSGIKIEDRPYIIKTIELDNVSIRSLGYKIVPDDIVICNIVRRNPDWKFIAK